MEEWLLRQYFWRFVASTKYWRPVQHPNGKLDFWYHKVSRSEGLIIHPDFGSTSNDWLIRYSSRSLRQVITASIVVPQVIQDRLLKRIQGKSVS